MLDEKLLHCNLNLLHIMMISVAKFQAPYKNFTAEDSNLILDCFLQDNKSHSPPRPSSNGSFHPTASVFKVHHSRLDGTASAPELGLESALPTQTRRKPSQLLHNLVTEPLPHDSGKTTIHYRPSLTTRPESFGGKA